MTDKEKAMNLAGCGAYEAREEWRRAVGKTEEDRTWAAYETSLEQENRELQALLDDEEKEHRKSIDILRTRIRELGHTAKEQA